MNDSSRRLISIRRTREILLKGLSKECFRRLKRGYIDITVLSTDPHSQQLGVVPSPDGLDPEVSDLANTLHF